MHSLSILSTLFLSALGATAAATPSSTSQEFYLKTQLLPNQASSKSRFGNLYVTPYHTGAGFNDATLSSTLDKNAKGLFNGTERATDGQAYHTLVFDIDGETYYMDMEVDEATYAEWEPVEINIIKPARDSSGFYFNKDGLQWTNVLDKGPNYASKSFSGWIVCDWWHGVPQLFFKDNEGDTALPCSCAAVNLMPQYI